MTITETRFDMEQVNTVVNALVALGVEAIDITPDTELRADLDVDSAELVEVVASIAGSAPDGKALKHVRTVGQLVDFVSGHDQAA